MNRRVLVLMVAAGWLAARPAGADVVDAADAAEAAGLTAAVAESFDLLRACGLDVEPGAARRAVIEALIRTADPQARMLGEEDRLRLDEAAAGVAYDTGLTLRYTNGVPVVAAVRDGSPAAAAELTAGAAVLRVGDRPAGELGAAEVRAELRGPDPGRVRLTVRPAGDGAEREVDLERAAAQLPAIETADELPGGLGLLRLNHLVEGAGAKAAEVLKGWAARDLYGVILDLRGAAGGDVASAAAVAGLLASPGEVLFRFRDAAGRDLEVHRAPDGGTPLGMPVMVLVDERTRGAAEVLAAALAGTGRGAMLIGARTAGDPAVRQVLMLDGGGAVYLATRRLAVGGGREYTGGEGVRPDVVVRSATRIVEYDAGPRPAGDRREVTEEEINLRRLRELVRGDAALIRAVDLLQGLKALAIHGFGHEGAGAGR